MKTRKGQAYIYFVALILLFVIILLYNVFSPAIVLIEPVSRDFINGTSSTLATNAGDTLDIIGNVWHYWPAFFILIIFIWMIVAATRREQSFYNE